MKPIHFECFFFGKSSDVMYTYRIRYDRPFHLDHYILEVSTDSLNWELVNFLAYKNLSDALKGLCIKLWTREIEKGTYPKDDNPGLNTHILEDIINKKITSIFILGSTSNYKSFNEFQITNEGIPFDDLLLK